MRNHFKSKQTAPGLGEMGVVSARLVFSWILLVENVARYFSEPII